MISNCVNTDLAIATCVNIHLYGDCYRDTIHNSVQLFIDALNMWGHLKCSIIFGCASNTFYALK